MTKKEFVELFGAKAELKTKVEAERLTKVFLETLEEVLVKGESVAFIGFGKFEATERAARTCVNPQTKKPMKVAAKKVAKFKPGKNLLEKMNPVVEKKATKGRKKAK
ncbi:HU family DNA-binding protein [uncultured Fusobacterium sp.]|uniref:HU family DNA-binding protein n=1 Tax=uncultured Fusobacterium sp. TaxID=159267 RepID=UPI0025F69DAE|nr:HU family DNA-binding protein [uncultured Fusobacterium sp.]